MRIWIVSPYDSIPGEPWGHKHGQFLARTLQKQGHQVIFWNSNYSHATKQFRSESWDERVTEEGILIRLVPVRAYQSHVGLSRVLSLLDFARGFWTKGHSDVAPDAIFMSIPIPFSDLVAVRLAKRFNSALILDFRDLWPEIFEGLFPRWLRWFGHILLWPLYWLRTYTFRNATGLAAVCESYRELALTAAPQLAHHPNLVIYHTGVELEKMQRMMQEKPDDLHLPAKAAGEIRVIYAGTLGNNYDVETLLDAIRLLNADPRASHVKFLIAGDGPLKGRIIEVIEQDGLNNLTFLGTLNLAQLYYCYGKADIGLCIYSTVTTVGIPAKAFDYYCAGLPIVKSIQGEFASFLDKHRIGVPYKAGDPNSLAESVLTLANDPSRIMEMKQRMLTIAPEFDRDIQYAKALEILQLAPRVGEGP